MEELKYDVNSGDCRGWGVGWGGRPAVTPGDGHPTPRAAGPTVWLQSPGGGTSVS